MTASSSTTCPGAANQPDVSNIPNCAYSKRQLTCTSNVSQRAEEQDTFTRGLAALTKGTLKRLCSRQQLGPNSLPCDEHGRQQQRGTFATRMVFTKPFICRASNIDLESMLAITVTDNVRGPKRKLYAPTGPSYTYITEMEVTICQSMTGHQSSHSCIAPGQFLH